jgi:hypothetical protein
MNAHALRSFTYPFAESAFLVFFFICCRRLISAQAATQDCLVEQLQWNELKHLVELFDSVEVAPDEKDEYNKYATKLRETLSKRAPPEMPCLQWPTDPNVLRVKTGEFNMHPLVFPALLEAHAGLFTE